MSVGRNVGVKVKETFSIDSPPNFCLTGSEAGAKGLQLKDTVQLLRVEVGSNLSGRCSSEREYERLRRGTAKQLNGGTSSFVGTGDLVLQIIDRHFGGTRIVSICLGTISDDVAATVKKFPSPATHAQNANRNRKYGRAWH